MAEHMTARDAQRLAEFIAGGRLLTKLLIFTFSGATTML